MFTLECFPEDADLFFQLLNQRNDAIHKHFTRRDYKYKSVIKCLLQKNTDELTFQDIDIKDCIEKFTKTYRYYTYRLIVNPLTPLVSSVVWVHTDGSLRVSYGLQFISSIQINWKEQHKRSSFKLLSEITG